MIPGLTFCLALWLHGSASASDYLSTALWASLSVLAALGLAGLLFGLKMIKARSAAKTVPCEQCGRFIDAAKLAACPFCGAATGGQQEESS